MNADHNLADTVKSATTLHELLWPHKEALAARWKDMVNGTYPFETIGFLRTQHNRFANPVGYRTEQAAAAIMEVLFTERPDEEALLAAVDDIIRVRAIQDFSPEAAVGVIYAVKQVVRDVVLASSQARECLPALLAVESRIDAVALMAFGVYARCRETLHQMKVDEFKRQHSQVLRLLERRAGKLDKADSTTDS